MIGIQLWSLLKMRKKQFLSEVEILRWKDGDTFVANVDPGWSLILKKQTFRLGTPSIPIDTPELDSSNVEICKFGTYVRDFCSRYTLGIQTIESFKIEDTPLEDSFGRFLVDILTESSTLTQILLAKGYAIPWRRGMTKLAREKAHLANLRQLPPDTLAGYK